MMRRGKLRLVAGGSDNKPLRVAMFYRTVAVSMAIAAAVGFVAVERASLVDLGPAVRAQLEAMTGRATVVDGDTVEIRGQHIRFNGIDAPETRQRCLDQKGRNYRCGVVAAEALDEFLSTSRPLRCEFVDRDRYGRFVGRCFRADGKDVAAWLVRQGHALDWPRYSRGDYADEQANAHKEKTGLWAGTFEAPWDWRAKHHSQEQPVATQSIDEPLGLVSSASCKIKGNINEEGERIYHLPGQKLYSNTRVAIDRGER